MNSKLFLLVKGRENYPTLTYNAIRLACWKKGITCDLRFCRKVFASHLRQEGIQPEVVDLLEGRVAQSVLTRHYLVPQKGLANQVIRALERLKQTIEEEEEEEEMSWLPSNQLIANGKSQIL